MQRLSLISRAAAAATRNHRGAAARPATAALLSTRAERPGGGGTGAAEGRLGGIGAMSEDEAVVVRSGTSGRSLELNRPKALNALNLPMIDAITPVIQQWEQFRADAGHRLAVHADPDVTSPGTVSPYDSVGDSQLETDSPAAGTYSTVVDAAPVGAVMYGAGGKAFCAGGDIRALYDNGSVAAKRHRTHDFFMKEYRLNHLLGTTPTPIVSVLNGITMGGGVGLSVHGKVRVATEATLFAMPETGIGFFPDVGGGYFLPRLPHPGLGLYLALSGARLRGAEALAAGVATHYMPVAGLDALEQAVRNDLYRDAAADEATSDAAIAHVLEQHCVAPPAEASRKLTDRLGAIGRCFGDDVGTIEECVARLAAEAGAAGPEANERFQTGGDPDATWARKTLGLLARASPAALKVTFEQLRRGGGKHGGTDGADLGAVLRMEFRIAVRFMEKDQGSDFFEGVRALIVDKDMKPEWLHAPAGGALRALADADAEPQPLADALTDALGRVSPEEVAEYFAPLPGREGTEAVELELLR